MRPRSITPAIALLILLAPRTFRAADRIEIRPADVRWQPLPSQVIDVHVSPHDDRPWYVLRPIKSDPQLDTVKRCIEREFAQPAPQLVDATPALFEPTGRVWFVVRAWPPERNVLLGYDGKTWVERPSPKDQTFAARDGTSTPGHSPANVAVANRAFFPTHDHVHISDEANWSVHTLWERKGANDRPTVPTLIPEPDGKGLIAYAPGSPSPPWRWRDGKWTPLPLPPDARGIPITMAWPRGDEGALFLLNTPVGRYLRFARYDPAREPTIQQWIQRLGHEQFAAREEASGALSDQGPSAEPELRRAAREHPDAEIRTRATLLLQALADTRNTAPPHPPARVGPYRVGQDALSVNGDRHGRTFIGAASVQQGGRNLGPGILILHPDGDANFYGGETTLHQWNQGYSVLPVGPGKDLWTPGDGQSLPAALMDLSTHRARARLPAPLFHPVAARADGSLYVRAGDPYSHGSRNLMLYRPAATVDNVAPLALASTLVVKDRRIAVGDDGAVWAIDEQGHLVRFDGTQWRTVDKADIATLDAWAPGRDGAMIMNVDPGWILCLPQGRPPNPGAPRPEARVVSFTKTLRELVEKNRRPILELFSHSTGGEASGVGGDTRRLAIVVDAHQNIWAMTESETAVLAGDHWIDGDSILKKIQVIARVGDGRRVYVCDYDYQGHEAKGYLAAYDTNARRFTLENAPPSHTISGRMTRAITDPTGNLWLATFPNDARLLHPDGSTAAALDGHTAVFRDPSDVLWLNPNYSGDDGPRPFSLWRDGKILSTLDIPGSDDLTQLYSDPQGSLWAKTTIGLHRITPDPERPGHYTRGRLYDLPAVADPRAHVEFTPLGYVGVAVTPDPQRPEVAVLHLYKLPPPD